MAISLIQHGAIRTTEAKAKELRPFVERLISHARKGTVHARRVVSAELGNRRGDRGVLMDNEGEPTDKGVLDVLFDEIAPRYADRPGGYTRIIRLAERRLGDAGRQVILQLVEETKAEAGGTAAGSRRKRRAAKRHEAAAAAEAAAEQVEPAEAPAETEPAGEQATEDEPAADEQAEQAEQAEPTDETAEDEDEKQS